MVYTSFNMATFLHIAGSEMERHRGDQSTTLKLHLPNTLWHLIDLSITCYNYSDISFTKFSEFKYQVTIMTIYEIRVIAQNMDIDPKKKNKIDLIKSIQKKEGNRPCFRATGSYCDQTDCCWRSDCLK